MEVPGERYLALKVQKVGQQAYIPESVLRNVRASSVVDEETEALILRVSTLVVTQKVLSRHLSRPVAYPANPWQHAKQRFAPGWFTRRWPVVMTEFSITFDLDVDAMYPEVQIPVDRRNLLVPIFRETGIWGLEKYPGPAVDLPEPRLTYQELRNLAQRERDARNRSERY